MNKKQRNRKLVQQNKRNRIINRRYTSTIKTLSKVLHTKLKKVQTDVSEDERANLSKQLTGVVSQSFSIIDKAVKKGILHKNTAARKKSKISKLSKSFNIK
jgi:small subunit ribosomal protein S20